MKKMKKLLLWLMVCVPILTACDDELNIVDNTTPEENGSVNIDDNLNSAKPL